MSEKKLSSKEVTRENKVKVVGYLRENNLELITNDRGNKVIRGSLIISVDEMSSHAVQFYVADTTKSGEPSKDFEKLSELLPDHTITIASYLKENATADFKIASNAASKVWTIARFEEYASRVGERITSKINLKGFKAGFATNEKAPFAPCAEFTADVYVNALIPEVTNDNSEETGRLVVEGLLPIYDNSVYKVSFVAPVEDNIAGYIKANYAVGDTVTLKGDLISIQETIIDDNKESAFFGRGSAPQHKTRFIKERRIRGGSKDPIHQGEKDCITTVDIRDGLAAREVKMDANGAKKPSKTSTAPAAAPSLDF